ncbi:MAG: two-component system response regulator [Verrucomicrobia bacterium]|nr:MAG: two-component system response regulator [Verrucomicrobiota bacterium]
MSATKASKRSVAKIPPNRTILYVEDEENDIILVQLALEEARISLPLKTVNDGREAVAYLEGTGAYSDRVQYPAPGLVLLDLNLPLLSGMDVLEWIREQPQFANLPVVIYTSSNHPTDLEKARQLGASDFVLKPSYVHEIAQTLQRLVGQWLSLAE